MKILKLQFRFDPFHRPMKEPMNNKGVRDGDIQKNNADHMTCSTSDTHEKTGQLQEENDEQQSREFGLSRQLYQKVIILIKHLH